MSENLKYFPKTLQSLSELKQTAEDLAVLSKESLEEKRELQEKVDTLRQGILEKADDVERLIQALSVVE